MTATRNDDDGLKVVNVKSGIEYPMELDSDVCKHRDDPILTSLGMFIIDENEYPASSNRPNEHDILGGGASYAVLGGRVVAGLAKAHLITSIFDIGRDFSDEVKHEIDSWNTGVVFRKDPSRLTTRGVNVYDENDIRHFHYKTPKKRIEAEDIMATENLIFSKTFHFCCAIDRCESMIDKIVARVKQLDPSRPRPKFIFEPTPDACVAENYDSLVKMLHKVDVFTPNLNEAASFAGLASLPETTAEIEQLSLRFSPFLKLQGSGTLLRCGPLGCHVNSKSGVMAMLPAYHLDQKNVIDVTGGGNSFCGALATALVLSGGDWLLSGILANIVSGCIIERLGMAQVSDKDKWNGKTLKQRLKYYLNRENELEKVYEVLG